MNHAIKSKNPLVAEGMFLSQFWSDQQLSQTQNRIKRFRLNCKSLKTFPNLTFSVDPVPHEYAWLLSSLRRFVVLKQKYHSRKVGKLGSRELLPEKQMKMNKNNDNKIRLIRYCCFLLLYCSLPCTIFFWLVRFVTRIALFCVLLKMNTRLGAQSSIKRQGWWCGITHIVGPLMNEGTYLPQYSTLCTVYDCTSRDNKKDSPKFIVKNYRSRCSLVPRFIILLCGGKTIMLNNSSCPALHAPLAKFNKTCDVTQHHHRHRRVFPCLYFYFPFLSVSFIAFSLPSTSHPTHKITSYE